MKAFLMMRKDGKQCMAFESKFDRQVGDKINYSGNDYFVFMLHENLHYAAVCNAMFSFHDHLAMAKRILPNIFAIKK